MREYGLSSSSSEYLSFTFFFFMAVVGYTSFFREIETNCACARSRLACHLGSRISSLRDGLAFAVFSCALIHSLWCVPKKAWQLMLGLFNVRTDINARNCTRGLHEHYKRVDSRREIACRARQSNLRQQCAGPDAQPIELHPNPKFCFKVSLDFICIQTFH